MQVKDVALGEDRRVLRGRLQCSFKELPRLGGARADSARKRFGLAGDEDVNKPLPLPPFHPSVDDDVDSPFDREAAGKVPEPIINTQSNPRPPTPPPPAVRDRSGSQGSTQSRKPAAEDNRV